MDNLLQEFFELNRWTSAIERGIDKDIPKATLYQLTKPEVRVSLYCAIRDGKYSIAPPHTAQIPKDDGTYRTVYVNEPTDRIILSIANDLLFEKCHDMIHPRCKSYQKGIGCGKIVAEASKCICQAKDGKVFGWKADLSKYFDSVPLRYIDFVFDVVEDRFDKSALIHLLRKYYHSNTYIDSSTGEICESYQSLKQGCAVASWLADVILFKLDEDLSHLDGYYVRYSDDLLFIGPDYQKAMDILRDSLSAMEMKLNPKKVEYLTPDRWFKFLGYSIKGPLITLSANRIKKFQREIERLTIRRPDNSLIKATNAVNRFLYRGDDLGHSWATQVLTVCNVAPDIHELNKFVLDALKAVSSKKRRIGGLGYVSNLPDRCILRGRGRNVKANREKLTHIDKYLTLHCMRNALLTSRDLYDTLVRTL